jgi:dolichol-phosphate mannosyltransferase
VLKVQQTQEIPITSEIESPHHKQERTSEYEVIPDICVVIPTINEAGTIRELLEGLRELHGLHMRAVVVDDGSTDGTLDIVQDLRQYKGEVSLINRGRKLGLGTAIREGIENALRLDPCPDYIVTMDGDLSHDPSDLHRLVEECDEGSIVIGSRYIKGGKVTGWSLYRRMVSLGANLMARALLNIPARDCTSGYRCYRAGLARSIIPEMKSTGFCIQIETLSAAVGRGFRIKEVPITFQERVSGESKLDAQQIWEFSKGLLRLMKQTGGIME